MAFLKNKIIFLIAFLTLFVITSRAEHTLIVKPGCTGHACREIKFKIKMCRRCNEIRIAQFRDLRNKQTLMLRNKDFFVVSLYSDKKLHRTVDLDCVQDKPFGLSRTNDHILYRIEPTTLFTQLKTSTFFFRADYDQFDENQINLSGCRFSNIALREN